MILAVRRVSADPRHKAHPVSVAPTQPLHAQLAATESHQLPPAHARYARAAYATGHRWERFGTALESSFGGLDRPRAIPRRWAQRRHFNANVMPLTPARQLHVITAATGSTGIVSLRRECVLLN